ncbi:hypothetical protein E2C01_088563 [Portunus trituberculatus]|uniref:Uncharacterized protein n=1 Tax=Portunus trituberculatus TaxID=210409 RepID=A0A5B7JK84_PORTR|nr:hypothetical protein [Portunus trituberculatus]
MIGGASGFFVKTRSSNDVSSFPTLYLVDSSTNWSIALTIVNCNTFLLHCPALSITSISLQFDFLQLKSPTRSILVSLLIMLSRHFLTSLCISLCSSVPHVLVFGGTLFTYNFSLLHILF